MDRSNSVSWMIAVVLFIALIIVGYLWINTRRDLANVLAENRGDIMTQRDEIAAKCIGANADREACGEALDECADILREFSAELSVAATTTQTQ